MQEQVGGVDREAIHVNRGNWLGRQWQASSGVVLAHEGVHVGATISRIPVSEAEQ